MPSLRLAALAAALIVPAAADAQEREALPTAITNVRILSPGRPAIAKGTILLRDGLIVEVGADVEIPADATVLDAKGLVALPGFVDACAGRTVAPPDGAAGGWDATPPSTTKSVLAASPEGFRRGIRPHLRAADLVQLDEKAVRDAHRAGFAVACVPPPDGLLSGTSVALSLSGADRRAAVFRPVAALHARLGGVGGGYPGSLMGGIAHLRQVLLDAQSHRARWVHYGGREDRLPRPPADAAYDALLPALEGRLPVVFAADSALDVRRALAFAGEFRLDARIAGGLEAWKLAELLTRGDVPVLLSIAFPEEPKKPGDPMEKGKPEGPEEAKPEGEEQSPAPPSEMPSEGARPRRPRSAPDCCDGDAAGLPREDEPAAAAAEEVPEEGEPARVREDRRRKWEQTVRGAATLVEAGVRVAITTRGLKGEGDFVKNLRKAIGAGLHPDHALRALTVEPARLLGIAGRVGEIAPGRAASLVLWTGDLADEKAVVRHVFVDGLRYDYDKPEPARPVGTGRRGAARGEGTPARGSADLAGTWNLTGEGEGEAITATLEVAREGNRWSGTIRSRLGETGVPEISVDGRDVSFSITITVGDQTLDIEFRGTLGADGRTMEGTVRTGQGERKFKAVKEGPKEGEDR
ncbi:MAG: amidohydrolase family protein [Planctomycetales bacterium]|nr:amidohydrolase family protein [Planctomycetales bacterium]